MNLDPEHQMYRLYIDLVDRINTLEQVFELKQIYEKYKLT